MGNNMVYQNGSNMYRPVGYQSLNPNPSYQMDMDDTINQAIDVGVNRQEIADLEMMMKKLFPGKKQAPQHDPAEARSLLKNGGIQTEMPNLGAHAQMNPEMQSSIERMMAKSQKAQKRNKRRRQEQQNGLASVHSSSSSQALGSAGNKLAETVGGVFEQGFPERINPNPLSHAVHGLRGLYKKLFGGGEEAAQIKNNRESIDRSQKPLFPEPDADYMMAQNKAYQEQQNAPTREFQNATGVTNTLLGNSQQDQQPNYVQQQRSNYVEKNDPFSGGSRITPELVSSLMMTESGGDPKAVSPKGAQGTFQIMPKTFEEEARKLGLKNPDPFNPEHSRMVGVSYLKQLEKRYNGNIPQALAAYNWGMGNLSRVLNDPQKSQNWYNHLPEETSNYIPKILGDNWQKRYM